MNIREDEVSPEPDAQPCEGNTLHVDSQPPASDPDEDLIAEILANVPGARRLEPCTEQLPRARPISMMGDGQPWDSPTGEMVGVMSNWPQAGATMVAIIEGESLSPHLGPGDWVALRPQDHAADGSYVLARLSDGSYSLNTYSEVGGPHLTTGDPGRVRPPEGPFEIVALLIGYARFC